MNWITLLLDRLLSKNFILILGCQRSGTTLLYMMMTSHPRVTGLNEDESLNQYPNWREILKNLLRGKKTCYKLIVKTSDLEYIKNRFPYAHIVWIIRHPYAVLSSMKTFSRNGETWLGSCGSRELKRLETLFPDISQLNIQQMNGVLKGACIWKYKMEAISYYVKAGYKEHIVRYENLLKAPEEVMRNLLRSLGLSWSSEVLQHEKHHEGKRYDGNNFGRKPLDRSRIDGELCLSRDEIDTINTVAAAEMERWGYERK